MLVTFEGIDGIGKSHYSQKLYDLLKQEYGQNKVVLTHEPYGFVEIKKILLTYPLSKKTELLLFLALRNEHYLNTIKPCLNSDKIIICDRYIDSTVAYQGYGENISLSFIEHLNDFVTELNKPNLTFILTGNINCVKNQKIINKFERKRKQYFENVDYGFQEIAKKNNRCRLVNLNDSNFNPNIFLTTFKEFYNDKQ